MKTSSERNKRIMAWIKRLGFWGFLFFLAKGLFWLALFFFAVKK